MQSWPGILRQAVAPGAIAGLAGGVVFGTAMTQFGTLSTIALIVRADSDAVGYLVHMLIAAMIGVGFGLLVWKQRPGAGETLFWGLTYGALWWFIGPLTLLPVFTGEPIGWNLEAAQSELPALFGHLLYGTTAALVLVALRSHDYRALAISRNSLVSGVLAGFVAAVILGATIRTQNEIVASSAMMSEHTRGVAWLSTLVLGVLAGIGFALLYPRPSDRAGAMLVRGAVYGFLWWIVAALTIFPVIDGDGLTWSLEEARGRFETLPGFILFGAVVALLYHWFGALHRLLLSDDVRSHAHEGAGTQGLRALGRGLVAGIVGGLIFTLIMIQIDFLPTVANLVGSDSEVAGFFLHLAIASAIGISYGVLFRRQSYDLGSAIGWGVAYGFCWWILGALTLLPVLLGGSPQWTTVGAAAAFPALIGHLIYGAFLGATFYLLETRQSPWWVSRTEAEAARLSRKREQVLTSAPAVWALIAVVALTVPLLLGQA